MRLTSPVFDSGGLIPAKFTCDGQNINFPLDIKEIPASSQSLVIIMYDPDVPLNIREDGNWDHWLVWNIDPRQTQIIEDAKDIGVVGTNTGGENSYSGPCPPDREHRYFIDLYSIDTKLDLSVSSPKDQLVQAMQGHILAKATLMGKYNRT